MHLTFLGKLCTRLSRIHCTGREYVTLQHFFSLPFQLTHYLLHYIFTCCITYCLYCLHYILCCITYCLGYFIIHSWQVCIFIFRPKKEKKQDERVCHKSFPHYLQATLMKEYMRIMKSIIHAEIMNFQNQKGMKREVLLYSSLILTCHS